MRLSDEEFFRIVHYVRSRYGIDLSHKRTLITGRLENYLLREGYQSYREYISLVEQNPNGEEAHNLINVLTTNHTYFMREWLHFEYLQKEVLPWIKAKEEKKARDVRIWSAASSTGEEPYTIEMVLNDFFSLDNRWDTQVLATDISTRVLQKAKSGIYLGEQIQPLPETWKRRYFKAINEEEYQVVPSLRKQIVFRQFNLMDEIPFKGQFHVVFLRNVMIYFEEETKRQLLKRIYNHMADGGYLFIGTTESIDKTATDFRYIRPSVYRKIL
ncbi:MAG: protein-glutamate O-methyltransferase CheR [Butyribacter sp.]|nr:protein-glutamate O-methyltransferase CheR [bacterium]MDY3854248.1 protein-glutamate O-methyltransferase CheR [Butyribacter sp.]